MSRFVALVVVLASVVTPVVAACSSDDEPSAIITADDVSEQAGLALPDSMEEFRLTRIDEDTVHVTFTFDAADVDTFAADSGLEFTEGERVIAHASPLWDLNPDGTHRGGSDEFDTVIRTVDVVTDGDTATARISIVNDAG